LLGLAAFFNLNYKIIKNYNEIAYTKGYSLWFTKCVSYEWLTMLSVMTLDVRMFYFKSAAAIR
jgi:hypothetical protein